MASLQQYMENPNWRAMSRHALKPVNGGHYKRWVQGSAGMMSPMPIYSNEYSHLYLKRGQEDAETYRGNIKKFSKSVTPEIRDQVRQCSSDTLNHAGCQTSAIRHVYTKDSHASTGSGNARHVPSITPHPFNVSYQTGYSPHGTHISPNVHYGYKMGVGHSKN